MDKLIKKIRLTATIKLLTGLHIGGSKDSVEIGGIDLPVIKLALKERKGQPYIPGSSLKGKMRCLLEQAYGIAEHGKEGNDNGRIRQLFGYTGGNQSSKPSRLIVRDGMLTNTALDEIRKAQDFLDMPYTENKFENTINRIEGTAGNPRQVERVPAGAEFDMEFVINVWSEDGQSEEKDLLTTFKEGIRLLENDYLGGSGSRGYGQIEFTNWNAVSIDGSNNWKEEQDYAFEI